MTASGRPGRPVVLSLEQALSMPYATLRFVHLGWRVIRVEPTPVPGRRSKGDPNRYIGRPVAGRGPPQLLRRAQRRQGGRSPLNLKDERGREAARRLIRELPSTSSARTRCPSRHAPSASTTRPCARSAADDLIWCERSRPWASTAPRCAGLRPGDPGAVRLHGPHRASDGPPMQCGPPVIDLKAGDEVFAQVLHALWERERNRGGACIDVSMAHAPPPGCTPSLPMLDMGSPPEELRRNGNEHRQFIPVNAYPTADGFIYVAIGSDAQWSRLVAQPAFARARRRTASGPTRAGASHKGELHELIGGITRARTSEELAAVFVAAAVPHSADHAHRAGGGAALRARVRRCARGRPTAASCGCPRPPSPSLISTRSSGAPVRSRLRRAHRRRARRGGLRRDRARRAARDRRDSLDDNDALRLPPTELARRGLAAGPGGSRREVHRGRHRPPGPAAEAPTVVPPAALISLRNIASGSSSGSRTASAYASARARR